MGLTPNGNKLSVVYDKTPLNDAARGPLTPACYSHCALVLSAHKRDSFSRGRALRKLNGKQEAENRPPACAAPATVNVIPLNRFDVSPIPARAGGLLANNQ
jgi:hypothetical protein